MNKNYFKNSFLDEDFIIDEYETVTWLENNKKYFNCGCCANCLCDDNLACKNCGCNCNCDDIEDEYDYESESDEDEYVENENITHFDIKVIQNKEKKVRITLELNVMLNNKNQLIKFDLDINKNTYLKIAQELLDDKYT